MNTIIYWWLLIFWPGYSEAHTDSCHRFNGHDWARRCLQDGISIEEIRSMLDLDSAFDRAAEIYIQHWEKENVTTIGNNQSSNT